MATTRNIQMQYYNGTDYDTLYPQTTAELAKSLSINGGTLNGPLILNRDPVETMEAVNKKYIDNFMQNGNLVDQFPINFQSSDYTNTTMFLNTYTYNIIAIQAVFTAFSVPAGNIGAGIRLQQSGDTSYFIDAQNIKTSEDFSGEYTLLFFKTQKKYYNTTVGASDYDYNGYIVFTVDDNYLADLSILNGNTFYFYYYYNQNGHIQGNINVYAIN